MKKTLFILLAVLMVASLFVSCTESDIAYVGTVKVLKDGTVTTYYIKDYADTKIMAGTTAGPVALFKDADCTVDSEKRITFICSETGDEYTLGVTGLGSFSEETFETGLKLDNGYLKFSAGSKFSFGDNGDVVIEFLKDAQFVIYTAHSYS